MASFDLKVHDDIAYELKEQRAVGSEVLGSEVVGWVRCCAVRWWAG